MTPVNICYHCGASLPQGAPHRCPACHARIVPIEEDPDPDQAGAFGLAALSGMSGALIGFVLALGFIC